MARPPPSDTFADAPSCWAPLSPDGGCGGAPSPGRQHLFETPAAPADADPRGPARLRGRLQALLARSAALAGAVPRESRASWPDSFFDDDAQP
jgi:hypothetical protein